MSATALQPLLANVVFIAVLAWLASQFLDPELAPRLDWEGVSRLLHEAVVYVRDLDVKKVSDLLDFTAQ